MTLPSSGDPQAEYAALTSAAAFLDLSARPILCVRGEDRVSFLHGMVTQDVNGIPEPGAAYTALITVKGAMVSDGRILRRPKDLLLDTEPGFGDPVLEFLNRYLISEDAELENASEGWAYLGVAGPKAESLLRDLLGEVDVPSLENQAVAARFNEDAIWLVGARRLGLPEVDLLVPRNLLKPLAERLTTIGKPQGALWAGSEATEAARVEAGVPRFGQDMEQTTIPLEANLQSALHYAKGCYIGQEVIARATHRGHMNRKLAGLVFEGAKDLPPPKTELRRGEKKVGWVTSALRSLANPGQMIGLGYVHRDHLEPGTQLELATGGTAAVRDGLGKVG